MRPQICSLGSCRNGAARSRRARGLAAHHGRSAIRGWRVSRVDGCPTPREATQIGVSSFASGYCVQPQPPPGALPGKPPPSCSRRLCSGTAPRARCLRMGQPWPRTPIYCAPMPERGHNQTSSPAAPAAKSFGPKLARLAKKGPIRSRPPALEWACRSLRWQSAAPHFFSWPPIERGCSAPRQLDSGPDRIAGHSTRRPSAEHRSSSLLEQLDAGVSPASDDADVRARLTGTVALRCASRPGLTQFRSWPSMC
jgi:hypothetical protein